MARTLLLPRQAWAAIAIRTANLMAVSVMASVVLSYLILNIFSQGINETGLAAAFIAPLVLGGPMVFYLSLKHQELKFAYQQLEEAAARDSLTNCLNHGAFVEAVTAVLDASDGAGGALLVIDADHFKSINDRFGHASGDTALKLIVAAIRAPLTELEIVGRLGGEEFGVFLPNASRETARIIADRIRLAVRTIEFEAGDEICTLSVSVGGAVCSEKMGFNDLFRAADERLYKVKKTGRNNTDIVVIPKRPANEAIVPDQTRHLLYRGQKVRKA